MEKKLFDLELQTRIFFFFKKKVFFCPNIHTQILVHRKSPLKKDVYSMILYTHTQSVYCLPKCLPALFELCVVLESIEDHRVQEIESMWNPRKFGTHTQCISKYCTHTEKSIPYIKVQRRSKPAAFRRRRKIAKKNLF